MVGSWAVVIIVRINGQAAQYMFGGGGGWCFFFLLVIDRG